MAENPAPVERGTPVTAADRWVEGDETFVRLEGVLDGAVPWSGLLDDASGELRIDLSRVSRATPDGLDRFIAALRSLGADVQRCRVEGCRPGVIEPLRAARFRCPVTVTTEPPAAPPEPAATAPAGSARAMWVTALIVVILAACAGLLLLAT